MTAEQLETELTPRAVQFAADHNLPAEPVLEAMIIGAEVAVAAVTDRLEAATTQLQQTRERVNRANS